MIIIGERLNSSRPAVRDALAGRDRTFLVEQARLQIVRALLNRTMLVLASRPRSVILWIPTCEQRWPLQRRSSA
jgi:hypothetical protein